MTMRGYETNEGLQKGVELEEECVMVGVGLMQLIGNLEKSRLDWWGGKDGLEKGLSTT